MEDRASAGRQRSNPIHLGFVPLSDCAPIAVARETGLFERYGVNVVLSREPGWADVRDKIYHGELDAAQSIAGIAFALGLGFGDLKCEVAVPLILNLHGNAITLSKELRPAEIGRGEGLGACLANSWKKNRPFTLAATHRFSSHHILLHTWLRRYGLSSPDDARIIFLPPHLMPGHLRDGLIDGYCVGEPWNSQAVLAGDAWCVATSADFSQGHPEKVLLVSGSFLRERKDETVAMVAALLEACRMCQDPAFRDDLISILAMGAYTGASPEVLRNMLEPESGAIGDVSGNKSLHVFHGESVNRPTVEKASWVLAGLRSIGALPNITCGSLSRIYREDVFHSAVHCVQGA